MGNGNLYSACQLPLSKLGLPKGGPFGLVKKLLAQLLKLEAKMTNITGSQL